MDYAPGSERQTERDLDLSMRCLHLRVFYTAHAINALR